LNWKSYLVAVLLSSIILALAFIHNSGSQTTPQYDPWVDLTDDGYIDEQGNLRVRVMPKGNLKLFEDAQKIIVIDTFEKGLYSYVHEPYNSQYRDIVFYSRFVFTPKGKFNNVTSVTIQAIMSSSPFAAFNISIGMGSSDATAGFVFRKDAYLGIPTQPTVAFPFIFTIDKWWSQYLGPIPNSSAIQLLNAIKPGINIIRMDAKLGPGYSPSTVLTYKVEIYITYTYWDYAE